MRQKREHGAAIVEAVLLLCLIAAIGIAAFRQTGNRVGCSFTMAGRQVIAVGGSNGEGCQGDPEYCALSATLCNE